MSKKVKILISLVVAILLLAMGGTATVMAQEEESIPPPRTGGEGVLARVADILNIPQEELASAFNQARQEMRQETFHRFLNKAIGQGCLTQDEADPIINWWQQRPEAVDRICLPRFFNSPPLAKGHGWSGDRVCWGMRPYRPVD